MGWSVGWDSKHRRWRGYGVPAYCEVPGCDETIDRGLAYLCGDGEKGCGQFFCPAHLWFNARHGDPQMCERCCDEEPPFPLKPEHPEWLQHILTDDSWDQWRQENPETVERYRQELEKSRG